MSDKNMIESKKDSKERKAKTARMNSFIRRCLQDKIYIICFAICFVFILIVTGNKVQEVQAKRESLSNINSVKEITPPSNQTEPISELDISDYVGIYTRNIKLKTPIYVNELCVVESYKYVYQIKSDKTINKYYYNSCIGAILIKSDKLNYVYYGGARYIGSTTMNYTFAPNTLKEVDGYTYKVDDDLIVIRENKKINDVELDFYNDNIVLMTTNNLYLINNSDIKYNLPTEYTNINNTLNKKIYKSEIKYQYNFISFYDENVCYEELSEEEQDNIAYGIYSMRYDVNTNKFMDIKEIVTRTKSESCQKYEEDLYLLYE